MQTPEYTITNQTLANIAGAEYAKAIIESTAVLKTWEEQLKTEAKARIISYLLQQTGLNVNPEFVKKYLNKMPTNVPENVKLLSGALNKLDELAINKEVSEKELKDIYKELTGKSNYRSKALKDAVDPQEVLAEITTVFDWYNSFDSRESHPIVSTAILRAKIEYIRPFEQANSLVAGLTTILALKTKNYALKDYCTIEEHFYKSRKTYESTLNEAIKDDDYTKWIEYVTDGFNRELSTVAENIRIMAKDSVIAKAAGRAKLSARQERIITYLQDYGILQNKDFPTVFPNISEDTVLRELKTLMQEGIVVKRGKTKSSRYELN